GAVVESKGTLGDDALAGREPAEDLGLITFDRPHEDGSEVRDGVLVDGHDGLLSNAGKADGPAGNGGRLGDGAGRKRDSDRGAGSEVAMGIFDADPELDG